MRASAEKGVGGGSVMCTRDGDLRTERGGEGQRVAERMAGRHNYSRLMRLSGPSRL